MNIYDEPSLNPLFEDAVALASDPEKLNAADALQLAGALDVILDRFIQLAEQHLIYREALGVVAAKLQKANRVKQQMTLP